MCCQPRTLCRADTTHTQAIGYRKRCFERTGYACSSSILRYLQAAKSCIPVEWFLLHLPFLGVIKYTKIIFLIYETMSSPHRCASTKKSAIKDKFAPQGVYILNIRDTTLEMPAHNVCRVYDNSVHFGCGGKTSYIISVGISCVAWWYYFQSQSCRKRCDYHLSGKNCRDIIFSHHTWCGCSGKTWYIMFPSKSPV